MAVVDIIIPLYNKEKTVARTIQSILDQTVTDWRVIVVDDGSTDGSRAVVRRFADPRIEVIQQDNQGPGPARNTGIQAATAKYVAFLDADDQWYPQYLETTLAVFEQHDVAFVGVMYEEWPEQKDMTEYWAKRKVTPGVYEVTGTEHPKEVLSKLFFFHVGNTVVRRTVAVERGGFYQEEKCLLGEDTVFFAKLLLAADFAIIGPPAVRHNRQDSALSKMTHRPLDIFLKKPNAILDFLPPEKKDIAASVLAYHALRVAHFRARNGYKQDALYLKNKFPGMRQFKLLYVRLCIEIALSRWLPYWVKVKCWAGPPIRAAVRKCFGLSPKARHQAGESGAINGD